MGDVYKLSFGGDDASYKRETLFIGKEGSQYLMWNFIATLTGYIYALKDLSDTSFHYIAVALRAWGWQGQKCNSKCSNDINTEWAIPEKFLGF